MTPPNNLTIPVQAGNPTAGVPPQVPSLPDAVAVPPGLQSVVLSEDEAAVLVQILADPTHPTVVGREMPTADASILVKKVK